MDVSRAQRPVRRLAALAAIIGSLGASALGLGGCAGSESATRATAEPTDVSVWADEAWDEIQLAAGSESADAHRLVAGSESADAHRLDREESGTLYGGGQDAGGGNDRIFRDMALDAQSAKEEAKQLVLRAGDMRSAGDLRSAESALERAAQLDPQNEDAELDLAEVRHMLGESGIESISRHFFEQEKLSRDMVRAEIRRSINQGLHNEELENYDEAIRLYKSVLDTIRSEPFDLRLDEEQGQTEVYLERAEKAGKQKELDEQREFLKMTEQKALEALDNNFDYIKNQIDELHRRAEMSIENKNFGRAVTLYDQILTLNPRDEKARRGKVRATEEQHIHEMDRLLRRSVENYEAAVIDVEKSSVVYEDVFRYPARDDWLRLSPRVISIEEQVGATQSQAEKDIRRRLELPYTFGVPEETPLQDVLAELQNLSGINLFINQGDEGGDPDAPIQLDQLEQLPLKSLLNLILKQAGEDYGFIIKEGSLVIGPSGSLSEPKYFRSYEIGDLVRPKPDFPAPPLALDEWAGRDTGGSVIELDDSGDTAPGTTIPTEELLEFIARELAGKGEDAGEEPEGIQILGGKLSARITLEDHLKLAKILSRFRKSTGQMVTVESRFLDIQDNFLEEIGMNFGGVSSNLPNTIPDADGTGTALAPGYEFIDAQEQFNLRAASIGGLSDTLGSQTNPFNTSADGGGAYQINVLDAQRFQLEAILTAVAKTQEIRRLNSPRVTAFNTQTAHTLVVSQAAFIQDLEVNQTGVIPVINPVIGVLNTGSILELRPTISHDQKYVTLEIQPTLAEEIGRDVAVLNLSGNFTVVPVQLPILSVTKIKTTVSVPDGGTVLVGGLKREINKELSIGMPFLRRIPILNLIFGRKGQSTMRSNLFVLINANVTIVHEEEAELFGTVE